MKQRKQQHELNTWAHLYIEVMTGCCVCGCCGGGMVQVIAAMTERVHFIHVVALVMLRERREIDFQHGTAVVIK